jgi:hypothetical protein
MARQRQCVLGGEQDVGQVMGVQQAHDVVELTELVVERGVGLGA